MCPPYNLTTRRSTRSYTSFLGPVPLSFLLKFPPPTLIHSWAVQALIAKDILKSTKKKRLKIMGPNFRQMGETIIFCFFGVRWVVLLWRTADAASAAAQHQQIDASRLCLLSSMVSCQYQIGMAHTNCNAANAAGPRSLVCCDESCSITRDTQDYVR